MKKATSVDEPQPLDLDRIIGEARDTYRALVRAYADGRPIDQARLQEVLALSGKSISTFTADAVRLQQRFAAVEDLAAADAMQDRLITASETIVKLEEERLAECARHTEILAALRIRQIEAQVSHAELHRVQTQKRRDAEEVLQRTSNPGIATRVRRLQVEAHGAAMHAADHSRVYQEYVQAAVLRPVDPENERDPSKDCKAAAEAQREKQAAVGHKIAETNESARDPLGGMGWSE